MNLKRLLIGVGLGVSLSGSAYAAEGTRTEYTARDEISAEEDSSVSKRKSRAEAMVGAQYFWIQGKALPGMTLRAGKDWYWLDLEAGFIWSTEPSSEVDKSFLGNQLGAFAVAAPLRTRHVELRAGLGADSYWLWQIHSEKAELALAAKVAVHGWVTPRIGVFASARAHLLSTEGLELGTNRNGTQGSPVLLTTGVEWKF